jgi:ABC-2 type transport system ATP-binding protein
MRSFIEEINRERRTTVVLTTHDLDDVERLCKRIVIIDHGRVVFDGPTRELRQRFAPHRMLDITIEPGGEAALTGLIYALPAGITLGTTRELGATFLVDPAIIRPAQAIAEVANRVPVADLTVREPDLDGIIRHVYEAREGTG